MPIAPTERLARFVFSKSHINRSGLLKYAAFMPRPDRIAISVFRISGLEEKDIYNLGKWTEQQGGRDALKGRGDLEVTDVESAQGYVEAETAEHERHAHILGWPPSDEERRAMAQRLAGLSRGTLY